jgi:hypothetical protein
LNPQLKSTFLFRPNWVASSGNMIYKTFVLINDLKATIATQPQVSESIANMKSVKEKAALSVIQVYNCWLK